MLPQKAEYTYPRIFSLLLAMIILVGMMEFLPGRLRLVYLLGLVILTASLTVLLSRSVPLSWMLLVVFYFFPYETVNPLIREAGNYFSIYRRIFGVFSVWDLVLLLSLIVLLLHRLQQGEMKLKGIPWGPWLVILIFFTGSFLIGLLHVQGNLLSYGHTDLRRPFVASQAMLYMVVVYFLTANSLVEKQQIMDTVHLVKWLSIVLILYGLVKGVLILTGHLATIWPFGLPIILYNQMTMLYVLIFWGWISFLSSQDRPFFSPLWVLLAVFLILTSTRRFNYFILIAGTVLSFWLTAAFYRKSPLSLMKKLVVPLMGIILGLLLVRLIFPDYLQSLAASFRSINIFASNDLATNNDIRRAALENLWRNLEERPYTFLTGFGLGTTWKAIVYQPFDTLFKSVNAEFMRNSLGWYPQFPLPYVNLIFRYGIIGAGCFWFLCGWLTVRLYRGIGKMASDRLPSSFFLAALIFIGLFLAGIGDIYNPTAPILVGFLLALLEAAPEHFGEESRIAVE